MIKTKPPRGGFAVDQLPLFKPESSWRPVNPSDWPDFAHSEYLGIDTETHDPELQTRGPGFIRGGAEVIGISLGDESGRKIYLPFGHVEDNYDRDQVLTYVRTQLSRAHQKKCGANINYDLEALWSLGVECPGPLCDVQVAAPILDEEREGGYTLEALSQHYLGYGKSETKLREAAADYRLDSKKHMKYLPGRYVAEYAADDAENAVLVFMEQEQELKSDDVWGIFSEVEQPLQRVLFKMRLKGVAVDVDRAERLAKRTKIQENLLYCQIVEDSGFNINVGSSQQVARYLLSKGVEVPKTAPTEKFPDGNLSVKSEWLKSLTIPAGKLINEFRKCQKMRRDFVEGMILGENVRGRLHSVWNQLRKTKDEDEGGDDTQGTRTGRIAAANVNLTQIPARDPVFGKEIRSCFVADEGGKWGKFDYSQQEPRLTLHYSCLKNLKGAEEVRRKYLEDRTTDYHQATRDTIESRTGKSISRRDAKDIFLGRCYGMGKDKLSKKLGCSIDEAVDLLEIFDSGVPYVRELDRLCKDVVSQRGYIKTILGRKRRFNLWQKKGVYKNYGMLPVDYQTAVRIHGQYNVERYGLSKVLNALIQGSAGDQTKRAIVLIDAEGITCSLQVYDELGTTVYTDREVRTIQDLMEHSIDCTVPIDASPDVGPSWGEVEPYSYTGLLLN